jgi:Holliday junction resolvasome RuvABC ATP-dependent DNA helicase subunit
MRKRHEEAASEREIDPRQIKDDAALRPRSFDEYVGQKKVVDSFVERV